MANEQMRIAVGQFNELTDEKLRFATQLGVSGVQMNLLGAPGMDTASRLEYDALARLVQKAGEWGLRFEAVENVPLHFYDKVMLGLPGRDEQLAAYCDTIRNVGRAGIPVLGYHFMPNSVWSTSRETVGRGGATVRVFDMATVQATPAAEHRMFVGVRGSVLDDMFLETTANPVGVEQMWANYEYFLNGVLPVAEEAGVRLALHPDDPPVPELGGVARLFWNIEGFKCGEAMANGSPAWGLDLCLGCCSEMTGGAANVRAMIAHFGPTGRICYVHFRDVKGSVPHFAECFIGEGNYNAAETMALLKHNGFTGFLIDDHVPQMVDDAGWNYRGRAHAVGYMQGLLDAINALDK